MKQYFCGSLPGQSECGLQSSQHILASIPSAPVGADGLQEVDELAQIFGEVVAFNARLWIRRVLSGVITVRYESDAEFGLELGRHGGDRRRDVGEHLVDVVVHGVGAIAHETKVDVDSDIGDLSRRHCLDDLCVVHVVFSNVMMKQSKVFQVESKQNLMLESAFW